jgi:RNA polymerase sigma-70 factor (sigma-E family)
MGRRNDDDFVEFAEATRERLRRTAYLLCGDWHRASDITQEALIRVYVAWPRLEKKGGLSSYARRAVVSVAIDQSRRRSSTELPSPPDESRTSGHDLADAVSDRHSLMQALAALPDRQRACLVLRYFEDLPVHDVAVALGINDGTVKSQTSRALSTLRATMTGPDRDAFVVSSEGSRR